MITIFPPSVPHQLAWTKPPRHPSHVLPEVKGRAMATAWLLQGGGGRPDAYSTRQNKVPITTP